MSATSDLATSTTSNHHAHHPQQYFVQSHQGASAMSSEQRMSIEQVLNLIDQVNSSVSAGEFTSQLAHKIFLLCQQLKTTGQHLEQTHKRELNRVFVSLRQACCRDSGQLGTPCRLKMMELVELRAMGWRPNLAHTQYYLNRPEQSQHASNSPTTAVPESPSPMNTSMYAQMPMNPYSHHQFMAPPPTQPMFITSDMSPTTSNIQPQAVQAAPGYFLIPATGGWTPQMTPSAPTMPQHPGGLGIMGASPSAAALRGIAANSIVPDIDWGNRQAAVAAVSAYLAGNPGPALLAAKPSQTSSASNRSVQNTKSSKSPQVREEMTIRNSDSGKIMGVKGRRVAVIEELSKTVISFQKVDAKSKDRMLTITGSTEESIQYAKRLIEDTIRRTISPSRVSDVEKNDAVNSDLEDEEDETTTAGISIETAQDGTLKLCCDDPEMLQAAQEALSAYLNRAQRTTRMSAEERELRKERRKSMPLQSSSSAAQTPTAPPPTIKETRLAFTGSSPNLLAAAESLSAGTKELGGRITSGDAPPPTVRYDRSHLLDLRSRDAGATSAAAEVVLRARQTIPEILRNENH
jgi:hypothetical protein